MSSRHRNSARSAGTPHHKTVEQIYRDEHGALPNFRALDRRQPRRVRWLIAGGLITLAVLTLAAWASFIVFKPFASPVNGTLSITVSAPPTAKIGEEIIYRLRIANDDRIPIANAVLDVRLPLDFALVAADPGPVDARALRWTFGTLSPQAERAITLRGRLYGSPSSVARIEATALYRPGNFNADFQAVASASTTIENGVFSLAIEGPERVLPEQPVRFTINYEYTGAIALPKTSIILAAPETFTFTASEPTRSRTDELRWNLDELAPGTRGAIVIDGAFRNGVKDDGAARASAIIEPLANRSITIAESSRPIAIIGGDIALTATVNDQIAGLDAPFGSPLRFRIAIRNNSDAELRGLAVRATFAATAIGEKSVLDFNRLEDASDGTVSGQQIAPDRRQGVITWTAAQLPDFASLKSGEQRLIAFVLPVRSAEALSGLPKSATTVFTASLEIAATGTIEQSRRISALPITIRVK